MELEALKKKLINNNYSIIADINGKEYTSFDSGIKPVISVINQEKDFFNGAIVVDRVIGKASAILLTMSGARKVHGLLMSKSAVELLKKYNIEYSYDQLVDIIINRKGDDMCPMEKTILNIDDFEQAYVALNAKVRELNEK